MRKNQMTKRLFALLWTGMLALLLAGCAALPQKLAQLLPWNRTVVTHIVDSERVAPTREEGAEGAPIIVYVQSSSGGFLPEQRRRLNEMTTDIIQLLQSANGPQGLD